MRGGSDHRFIAGYTGTYLGANAHAAIYSIEQWDINTVHLKFDEVTQKADSKLNTIAVAMGGRIFRNQTTINLAGRGAENKVLGLLFGSTNQSFENWIIQNHTAPNTTSDIQYRGALDGSAKFFLSGLISIKKQAQRSDAYQSVKNLLLSSSAKAEAIPNLEILADDVKCSHGAAVGPVDEEQKFYLQTRGIPPKKAEEMIIQGFFDGETSA